MSKSRANAGIDLARSLDTRATSPDVVLGTAEDSYDVSRRVGEELGVPVGRLSASELRLGSEGEVVGAVASDGSVWFDSHAIRNHNISHDALRDAVTRAHRRAHDRAARFEQGELLQSLAGKWVALVDDGTSPTAVIIACIRNARAARADRITVALPAGTAERVATLRTEADRVVCPETIDVYEDEPPTP